MNRPQRVIKAALSLGIPRRKNFEVDAINNAITSMDRVSRMGGKQTGQQLAALSRRWRQLQSMLPNEYRNAKATLGEAAEIADALGRQPAIQPADLVRIKKALQQAKQMIVRVSASV